jgi:hypothetical protein
MTTETTCNLSREVAEALGWRFEPQINNNGEAYWYDVYNPDGKKSIAPSNLLDLEYPDYPNDLNACARDLTRAGYRVVLKQMADGSWVAYFTFIYDLEELIIYGEPIEETESEDTNPALAWCESFLALDKYIKESNHD